MTRLLTLSDVGVDVDEARVLEFQVNLGDWVYRDQSFVEISSRTWKGMILCPYSGRVEAIHATCGDAITPVSPLMSLGGIGTIASEFRRSNVLPRIVEKHAVLQDMEASLAELERQLACLTGKREGLLIEIEELLSAADMIDAKSYGVVSNMRRVLREQRIRKQAKLESGNPKFNWRGWM